MYFAEARRDAPTFGALGTVPDDNLRPRVASVTSVIHDLAARQHGVVTRRQLLEAGVSRHRVDHLRTSGGLRPVQRGVYAVGPVSAPLSAEMAACLASGPHAVVSHQSAALLWRIPARADPPSRIHLSTPHRRRALRGIHLHRVGTLHPDEVTRLQGIPLTTPARTLLDLAAAVPERFLERALAEALARRVTTLAGLATLVGRHGGMRGVARLRCLVEAGRPALTRSEAEAAFLELMRRAKIPEPGTNVRVAGHEVDFVWRPERLIVEVDGYAFHSSPQAFQRDRTRDADLAAAGFRVIRVTWQQLTREREAVIARTARALGPHTAN